MKHRLLIFVNSNLRYITYFIIQAYSIWNYFEMQLDYLSQRGYSYLRDRFGIVQYKHFIILYKRITRELHVILEISITTP